MERSRCLVPGMREAFIPGKDESHGSTEEIPRQVAATRDQDGRGRVRGPATRPGALTQIA